MAFFFKKSQAHLAQAHLELSDPASKTGLAVSACSLTETCLDACRAFAICLDASKAFVAGIFATVVSETGHVCMAKSAGRRCIGRAAGQPGAVRPNGRF